MGEQALDKGKDVSLTFTPIVQYSTGTLTLTSLFTHAHSVLLRIKFNTNKVHLCKRN